jgi:hypothetical protein
MAPEPTVAPQALAASLPPMQIDITMAIIEPLTMSGIEAAGEWNPPSYGALLVAWRRRRR